MPEPPGLLIALTGYGQTEDRVRAKQAGFHHHFVKPADPRGIQATIAQWQQRQAAGEHTPSAGSKLQ
jgi:CheY-like chemotaxis protein